MPTEPSTALITNDIVGLGLIAATLAVIFWAASGPTPLLKKVFAWVPALLLCYFIPAIYNTAGLIDGHNTSLYNPIARDVLLPAALVLLTLSIDLKGIMKLGPKLLVVFCAGTLGIILGAIVSFQTMSWIHPATVAGDTWKGMAALAGRRRQHGGDARSIRHRCDHVRPVRRGRCGLREPVDGGAAVPGQSRPADRCAQRRRYPRHR
jgi:uncharacterized membrane protein